MAWLVECRTEKTGAVLMRVERPGETRHFSLRVGFQRRLSAVFVQLSSPVAWIDVNSVHVKKENVAIKL